LAGYGAQSASPKPGDVPNAGEPVKSAASLCKDGNYYSDLTTSDQEWTIAATASTETQTFYCINDQGHFGYVQLIHSNLGYVVSHDVPAQGLFKSLTLACMHDGAMKPRHPVSLY